MKYAVSQDIRIKTSKSPSSDLSFQPIRLRGHAATDTEKNRCSDIYFRFFPKNPGTIFRHYPPLNSHKNSPSVPAAILLLDDGLQVVIGFRSQFHGFGESGGPHWNQEKLLAEPAESGKARDDWKSKKKKQNWNRYFSIQWIIG